MNADSMLKAFPGRNPGRSLAFAAALVGLLCLCPSAPLAKKNTVAAGVLANFSPQYELDPDTGDPRGFAIDTLEAVADQAGIDIEYRVFETWEDVQQALRDQLIDIIPNMGITEDRKAWMLFTQPLEVFDVALFVRASTHDIQSVDDLRGRHVAVVTTNIGATLAQSYEGVTAVRYQSASDALLSLLSGQTDALIYPAPPLQAIARKARLETRIKIVGKPLVEIKRAVAVRQDRPALLAQLDSGVRELLETPRYREIYARWYGEPSPLWTAGTVALVMGILLMLVIVSAFVWRYYSLTQFNSRLRQAMTESKQAQDALQQSERLLRSIADNYPHSYVSIIEKDLTVGFTSGKEFQAQQLDPDSFVGLSLEQVFGKQASWVRAQYLRVFQGEEVAFELEINSQHQRYNAVPLYEENGEIERILAVVENITERKQSENALTESERKYRHLFEFAQEGIWVIDADAVTTMVNPSMARMLGYTVKEMIGKHLFAFMDERDVPQAVRDLGRRRQGIQEQHDFEFVHKNGIRVSTTIATAPIFGNDGAYAGAIAGVIDITGRKLAQKQLQESEERYRLLIEMSPDTVGIHQDGKIVFINQAGALLFGAETPAQLIGASIETLVHPDGREKAWERVRRMLAGETGVYPVEERYITLDGSVVPVEVTATKFTYQGKPAIQVVARDISERKQAELALRESEERFRRALEHIPAVIAIYDDGLRIRYINAATTRITGRPVSDFLGKREDEIWPPEIYERYLPMLRKTRATRKTQTLETLLAIPEKGDRFLKITCVPLLHDATGEIREILGVTQDLTEIKRAEQEIRALNVSLEQRIAVRTAELHAEIAVRRQTEQQLLQARDTAESANRAKSEFLANMSHDLRTPLNAILGYAQLLEDAGNLSERQRDGLHTIHSSGEHLLTLINDILNLSKIEAGRLELTVNDVALDRFLQELTAIIQVRAVQKHLTFRTEFDPAIPTGIRTDEKRLREVLFNLLGNAIKFTDRGQVTFKVTNMTGEEEQLSTAILQFSVTDSGVGIAPEDLERIFDAFQQVGETRADSAGTGLGLSISQRLVRMMGGELQVRSELGTGSTFWFQLPLPVVDQVVEDVELPSRKVVGYAGPRRTILIVDDERANRGLLANLLFPLGFRLIEAENGEECIQKALKFRPDAVLLDLRMPILDGFGATAQMRAIKELQEMPILAVSASVFEETRQRALEEGFTDFLLKPIQIGHILHLLTRHLDITWQYAEPLSPPAVSNSFDVAAFPPALRMELKGVYEAAIRGNQKTIRQELDRLEQVSEEFLPFVRALRPLAKQFAIEAIVELLESIGMKSDG